MRPGTEKELYKKVGSKKIVLHHVCEVGVFLPEMSNILDFIVKDRLRTTLVEPDNRSIAAIREYFRDYNNVTLLPYAVYDHHGVLELVQCCCSLWCGRDRSMAGDAFLAWSMVRRRLACVSGCRRGRVPIGSHSS